MLVWWNDVFVLLITDTASQLLQGKRNDLFLVVQCFYHTSALRNFRVI